MGMGYGGHGVEGLHYDIFTWEYFYLWLEQKSSHPHLQIFSLSLSLSMFFSELFWEKNVIQTFHRHFEDQTIFDAD